MAGKTKDMSKIKQLLRLHLQGVSNRKIAAELDINKETVNNYIRFATSDPLGFKGLLELDDPVLEHRLKGGNPAYPDERFEDFKARLPYLQQEMRRKHVTLKLLWEEYIADTPQGYSLTQFRFHYKQHTKAQSATSSTVLSDLYVGGEKIYFDFAGDTLEYIDLKTGEIIKAQVFVACLPATDYGYVLCVPSQRSEDFIYAIGQCFKEIGGVPKIIVTDNLKSAVVRTDPYEPEINRMLEDLANHYGCVVVPARPLRPKDKGLVEDHVKLVYRRVYAELRNERFYSLEELNAAVAKKVQAHNRKRMSNRPYSREEQFLAIEQPALSALPDKDFEIRNYASLKVGVNGCVYLGRDKHYYSVPYTYIGSQSKVVYTRTLVKIYCGGECVATHTRDYAPGKYTLVKEHLASNCQAYRERSPQYYIDRGKKATEELGEVIQYMFATATVPAETFYRSCEGLLHLQRSTDPALFRRACEAALTYQNYRYGFILKLVQSGCRGLEDLKSMQSPPTHENIRGKGNFK